MKTTSYEISKKLADIGFKSNSGIKKYVGDQDFYSGSKETHYIVFCLETILQSLPKIINQYGILCALEITAIIEGGYKIGYGRSEDFRVFCSDDESLADAASKLIIKLFESRIINFDK
jgi:hypothetical protein